MNRLVIIPVLEGRHKDLKECEAGQLLLSGGAANKRFEIKSTKRTLVRLKADNMVFLVGFGGFQKTNLTIPFF